MKNVLIVGLVLLAGGPSVLAAEANPEASGPTQNGGAKEAWTYFPHRQDLVRDGSLAKNPAYKPPHILKQHGPKAPGNLPPGQYRLCLAFIVEADGAVREATVAESSGVRALDDTYLAMVKKWRYTPATMHGKKIATALLLPAGLER